jgi:choline dehydrogenase-like flavoprotein
VDELSTPDRKLTHYRLVARSEMRPSASNRVEIMADESRSGLYRVSARCVFDAGDLRNVENTIRLLGETLIRLNRGRVRVNNDAIYRDLTGGGHIMGTTRMGRSRSSSVVDEHGRVHGYRNFFVAGSSVFPTAGYANPTFTIVALAVRLADYIAGGAS